MPTSLLIFNSLRRLQESLADEGDNKRGRLQSFALLLSTSIETFFVSDTAAVKRAAGGTF